VLIIYETALEPQVAELMARHAAALPRGSVRMTRWMLSATPGQPKERKKNHGAMRNMITA